MRTAGRTGRFAVLVALLLVFLGVSAAAGGTGEGPAAHRAPVIGEPTPSTHSDLHDLRDLPDEPVRLSATAPHALTTALPDPWGSVCFHVTGGCPLHGRSPVGEADGIGMVAAAPAPWSSRAPPSA